jgi:hypothetical protein
MTDMPDTTYVVWKMSHALVLEDFVAFDDIDISYEQMTAIGNELALVGTRRVEPGNSQVFIRKLEKNSLVQNGDRSYGPAVGDEFGVSVTPFYDSDSLMIVGSTNAFKTDDLDAYICLVDEANDSIWERGYGWNSNGANADDFGVNAVSSYDNAIYLGLTTNTFGQGGSDYHVYKMDTAGIFILGTSHGLSGDEVLKQLYLSSDSTYFMIGVSSSVGIGGDDILIVKTKNFIPNPPKAFVTYRDDESTVEPLLSNQSPISDGDKLIISNGLHGYRLSTNEAETITSIEIIDMNGRLIKAYDANESSDFFVPHFSSKGVYLISILMNQGQDRLHRKIVGGF